MTSDVKTLYEQLLYMEKMFCNWADWNKALRDKEGLTTTDDSHIISIPPEWPSHGTVRQWSDLMRHARTALVHEVVDAQASHIQKLWNEARTVVLDGIAYKTDGIEHVPHPISKPEQAEDEAPVAWRWTQRGDKQRLRRLNIYQMFVQGDVVEVEPLYARSAPKPAADVPAGWSPSDLVVGGVYKSKNAGYWEYKGWRTQAYNKKLKLVLVFTSKNGARTVLAEDLNEFLAPPRRIPTT